MRSPGKSGGWLRTSSISRRSVASSRFSRARWLRISFARSSASIRGCRRVGRVVAAAPIVSLPSSCPASRSALNCALTRSLPLFAGYAQVLHLHPSSQADTSEHFRVAACARSSAPAPASADACHGASATRVRQLAAMSRNHQLDRKISHLIRRRHGGHRPRARQAKGRRRLRAPCRRREPCPPRRARTGRAARRLASHHARKNAAQRGLTSPSAPTAASPTPPATPSHTAQRGSTETQAISGGPREAVRQPPSLLQWWICT